MKRIHCLLFSLLLFTNLPLSLTYDYCKLSQGHTMCKYQGVGGNCGSNFIRRPPTQTDINIILDWHNNIRQRVAAGTEHNSNERLKSASNMMKMHWDPELAAIAQRWADQCTIKHDCSSCRYVKGERFGLGQNIAAKFFWGTSPQTIDWERSMIGWYDKEVEVFRNRYVNKFRSGDWGHYSQIIWWNTRSIGCGATIYKDGKFTNHLMVCNYGARGNILNRKVYEAGSPCSNCPQFTKCDTNYHGLCAPTDPNFNVGDEFSTDSVVLSP